MRILLVVQYHWSTRRCKLFGHWTGHLVSLSEQQLLDCDQSDFGCQGGWMSNAFQYIIQARGLMEEKEYAFAGREGSCKFEKSEIMASVSNYNMVYADQYQISASIVKHGPVSTWMQTYVCGVSCPDVCAKEDLSHAVLLVGFAKFQISNCNQSRNVESNSKLENSNRFK
ncbi:putative cathepsin L [Medicago truncatula]|uniref:Putative cathepsin L n=1 Tax=Medicago truncatula TaxID=3880 RepID=A0A396GT48_MEDTR|nr:putative cathepsin L [Medicago truncatula]